MIGLQGLMGGERGSLASQLRSRDAARLQRYQVLYDWWAGRHFKRTRRGRTDLVLNYCRAISDKAIEYLFSRGIAYAVPTDGLEPATEEVAQRAELVLAAVLEDAAFLPVLLAAGGNASVVGDAFVKCYFDQVARRVRVVSLDPARCFPTAIGDDVATMAEISVISTLSAAEAERRYGVRSGRAVDVVETWTASTLRITAGGAVVQDGPNPYGWIPIAHVANLQPPNDFWGRSDLEDVIPLNEELDRRVSDEADVIAYHADPPVVFRGVRQHSDLPVGPGTVWDIPADAEVSLLEWRGQAIQVDAHITRVQEALFQVAETPRTAFGDSGRLLSGVALETELQPLILRTLRKRASWEPVLRRLGGNLLRLAEFGGLFGVKVGDFAPYRTRVVWEPMLPRDDDAEAVRALNLVAGQLRSHERAMEDLGELNPAHEIERINANRAELGIPAADAASLRSPSSAVPAIHTLGDVS